jgi:hypothetical protein
MPGPVAQRLEQGTHNHISLLAVSLGLFVNDSKINGLPIFWLSPYKASQTELSYIFRYRQLIIIEEVSQAEVSG